MRKLFTYSSGIKAALAMEPITDFMTLQAIAYDGAKRLIPLNR
jgi:hypothetical protein